MLNKFKDNCGATAIEYGLIAAAIATVIVGSLQFTGTNLKQTFCIVASAIGDGDSCGSSTSSSTSSTSSGNGSYNYNGVYKSDVDSLFANILKHEKEYIAAWKTTQAEKDYISTLTNANEINQLTNSTLQNDITAESAAYNDIINDSDSSGMSEDLNQLYSVDYNKSLASGGQTQAAQDMATVGAASFTSSTGKSYTVQSLENNNSDYLNGLTSVYARH